jgi:hypothetical protein
VTSVVEAVEGLVLDSHGQNEVVVRDNIAVIQDDVLVRTVDVYHAGIKDTHSAFEHQLL